MSNTVYPNWYYHMLVNYSRLTDGGYIHCFINAMQLFLEKRRIEWCETPMSELAGLSPQRSPTFTTLSDQREQCGSKSQKIVKNKDKMQSREQICKYLYHCL